MVSWLCRQRGRARGQALVEAALVAPLFFLILFGIIDLGRVIWANDVVSNAAREGARFASVNAGTVGLTTETTKDAIRDKALDFVIAGGTGTTVNVCFSTVRISSGQQGCAGDTDEQNAAFQRGNLVTVTVASDVPLVITSILGGAPFRVTAQSTVLINN